MPRLTRAQLLAEVEALRISLAKEEARRRRLERKLARELGRREHAGDAPAETQAYDDAVGEILRLITSSPGDAQLVCEAIARHARTLCQAASSAVVSFDGEWIRITAMDHLTPESEEAARRAYPLPPDRGSASGRAVLTRQVVHITDTRRDPEYDQGDMARAIGNRSIVSAPMLRRGEPVGCINVWRPEAGPFSDRQIALLVTFAEQAVIAIENARLFQELQARNAELTESLAQQTATGEILRVISGSPTQVQPVFDTITRNAVELCGAASSLLTTFDGELLHLAALSNVRPGVAESLRRVYPMRPGRGAGGARAILTRAVVHIPDLREDPEYALRDLVQALDFRSILAVPMLREGEPIGTINVHKVEPEPFPDSQIALLKTFADQAVIAIENVRLFKELDGRNRDLTVALEQQTATAEILRVISSSPTDVQPVFDTIVRSAVRLCDGLFSALFRFDGELIHHAAQHNYTPEALEAVHRAYPMRLTRALGSGRAILERAVVQIPDVELDPEHQHQALSRAIGFRSGLFVPMLREGAPIGVIMVARAEPGSFSDNEIGLLKTFADQAVIAIENVRLFKELQARTTELTRSVEQLTALGEVSRAVSSTLDVETVLDTIVSRASQLAGGASCSIYEYDEATQQFALRASHN